MLLGNVNAFQLAPDLREPRATALGVAGADLATGVTNLLLPLACSRGSGLSAAERMAALGSPSFSPAAWAICPRPASRNQMALEANAFDRDVDRRLDRRRRTAAHQVVINMASFTFMFPLGIAIGASARAGNLIGERDSRQLRIACRTALAMGGGVMALAAIVFLVFRASLPQLYVADHDVTALAASLLPIAGASDLRRNPGRGED
jgi:hypothetical protein